MKACFLFYALLVSIVTAFSQTIELDKNFGDNGIFSKGVDDRGNVRFESAEAIIELADGRLLAVIKIYSRSYLCRFERGGNVDRTFGTDGILRIEGTSEPKLLQAPNGNIYLIGKRTFPTHNFLIQALKADGNIITSYGNSGVVILPEVSRSITTMSAIVQSDNKLLLLSHSLYYDRPDTNCLVRIQEDGRMDKLFGTGGIKYLEDEPGENEYSGLCISNSRIIVSTKLTNTGNKITLIGYRLDGSYDSTFGFNGKTAIVTETYHPCQLLAQPDGKILAAFIYSGSDWQQRIAINRFLPSGAIDYTFNGSGKSYNTFKDAYVEQKRLLIDKDGNIYSVNELRTQFNFISITKFNTKGSIDKAFGNNGVSNIIIKDNIQLKDAAISKNGSVCTAGYNYNTGSDFYFITKTNASGKRSDVFGDQGIIKGYIPSSVEHLGVLKQSPTNALFAQYEGRGTNTTRGIIHILDEGLVDTTYGQEGLILTNDYDYSVFPNGELITVGYYKVEGGSDSGPKLTRYLPNGQRKQSFGTNGQKAIPLSPRYSFMKMLALNDGSILIFGSYYDKNSVAQNFLTKLDVHGAIEQQFGDDGYIFFKDENVFKPDGINSTKGWKNTHWREPIQFKLRHSGWYLAF